MLKTLGFYLLIATSIALFLFADEISRALKSQLPAEKSKLKKQAPRAKTVARVRKINGEAILLRHSMKKLVASDKILAGDTIQTSKDSRVELKMSSGHRIKIDENSEVVLHLWMDKYTVYRHSGNVELINSSGATDQLVIADDNSAQYIESNLQPREPKETGSDRLSNAQILAAIRPHRPKMYRCYLNSIKKGQTNVEVNFHIEPSGKVNKAWIAHSTSSNKEFQRCLVDIFKQARFPGFNGKTIPTKYPIKFE